MKETGLLMSTPMVLADLKNLKHQTRRTWGLNKINESPDDWSLTAVFQDGLARFYNKKIDKELTIKCPYGGLGDELYCKETYAEPFNRTHDKDSEIPIYKADGILTDLAGKPIKWKSSMFMPRKYSRRSHILINIGCERVQGITEEDAIKEGVNGYITDKFLKGERYKVFKEYHHQYGPFTDHLDIRDVVEFDGPNLEYARFYKHGIEMPKIVVSIPQKEVFDYIGMIEPNYRDAYRVLWDKLNAKRGHPWSRNDWIWILEWKE